MMSFSLKVVNHFVLGKQHLADDVKLDDVVQIVKDVGGLHASGSTVPYLSLFSRTRNFTRETLDDELYSKRTLGKIRCVRKTVYVFPKELIATAFVATRRMVEPTSEQYAKSLGITQKDYRNFSNKILVLLQGRGMATRVIKKALGTRLNISPILNLLCDQGFLIRGKPEGEWKSSLHTYHLFNDYFPDLDLKGVNEDAARRLLVEQYLTSFGPATETDVAWWTGFPRSQIRQLLDECHDTVCSAEIQEVKGTHFLISSQRPRLVSTTLPRKPVINVLPNLDPYLMGYKDRERCLNLKHYPFVFDRAGNATSTILLNGRVVGIWDFTAQQNPLVKTFLLEDVPEDVRTKIAVKAREMGRFIAEKEVQINECDAMIPLTQRTAGGFMSPLKNC